MEMQFYPPGNPPFADSASCDDPHWCAALTIDSLEGTAASAAQPGLRGADQLRVHRRRNGVPTGPPSPQDADLARHAQSHTLLMNPGDTITVHMFDAPAPGGGNAFEGRSSTT